MMEKSGTCTGPTIAGISREEQSVRFDILSPGSKVNTRFYLWLYRDGLFFLWVV